MILRESDEDFRGVLEGQGVDPDRTPVDRLPEHAQWALAALYYAEERIGERD